MTGFASFRTTDLFEKFHLRIGLPALQSATTFKRKTSDTASDQEGSGWQSWVCTTIRPAWAVFSSRNMMNS
jgi:hypothetical protein